MNSDFFDTSYTYNVLDKPTQVSQGSQTRSFAYDWLLRSFIAGHTLDS